MEHNVLVDSDFLIALYSEHDTNHRKAHRLLEILSQNETATLSLSIFVYSETLTVLAQRVSQKTAHFFMDDIREQGIEIIMDIHEVFEEAENIFRSQRSKNVSFVDAVNIALMRNNHFDALLSFDHDYRKNRIKLYSGN